jgi:RNA polymerase sigma-70 factor, ECF subfamily
MVASFTEAGEAIARPQAELEIGRWISGSAGVLVAEMRHALSPAAAPEGGLLGAAQRGDEYAWRELVEPLRPELHAHCYRMLGSAHDADDALQDTLLRAWRALPGFEGRGSLRAWLYRIATNSSIKLIQRRPQRVMPLDYGAATDPREGPGEPRAELPWLEPYPEPPDASYEQREGVELAFVAALQHLPPRQRAVLILRDVLGFSAGEVGEVLQTAPDAVYSILQRAHRAVNERLPERSQQETLRSLGDERLKRLAERFVAAWEDADVDAIMALLADDATIAMPPRPSWYRGREAIRTFLAGWPLAKGHSWRLVSTRANGQLAFVTYGTPADAGEPAHALQLLTLTPDGAIQDITAFLDPDERWIQDPPRISVAWHPRHTGPPDG